jgi:hypothetical protein
MQRPILQSAIPLGRLDFLLTERQMILQKNLTT